MQKSPYETVLDDLANKRSAHLAAVKDIDNLIAGIKRHMAGGEQLPLDGLSAPAVESAQPEYGQYSRMSLKSAVLHILGTNGDEIGTAEIVELLRAGGAKSSAQNMVSTVSATLSVMGKEGGLVERGPNGWRLTDKGIEEAVKLMETS